jgi:hypothetical protein
MKLLYRIRKNDNDNAMSDYVRRSAKRWSATRMALAMMVRDGFTAPQEGKKLASTT